MRQRIAALVRAVSLSKEGELGDVPSFVPEWRARRDSNSLPLGSKPSALSK